MAVPGARADEHSVPAPLPPPRYIEALAAGSDPGWKWGNTPNQNGFGGNPGTSISSTSSLRGSWDQRMEDEGLPDRYENSRRGSSGITTKPTPELERKYDFSRNVDEGYHSLSGSSISSHRLHGEMPLAQKNVETASQAYDNKLLSKIGKPKSPPPVTRTSSVDAASPSSSLQYYQSGRHPHQLKSLSISEGTTNSYSSSPFRRGPLSSQSAESPRSRAISPSLLSSAASAKSFMEWRSPTWDTSTPMSAVSEPQSRPPQSRLGSFSSQYQQQRRQSRRRSVFSNYDESAPGLFASDDASRGSKRGSQDQSSTLTEPDTIPDFPYVEETGAMRQLHLEDRAPLSLDPALQQYSSSPIVPSDSRSGMKRRASSPPPDSSHDDKAPLHSVGSSSDLYQRNNAAAQHPPNRASPVNKFGPQQGSVSSASPQGLRNGSYASSGALSVGSSLTSHSPNRERLSPTSEYPYPQPHPERDSPYITTHPSPRSSVSHSHSHPPSAKSSAAASRKMSSDGNSSRKQSNPPNLQAPGHICQCCPKKPKKFETLEDLRAHESEKQYECSYCHNRFKNKNEAERHQNSLHVRKNSWSCAALAGEYQRVFHPAAAVLPQHPNQPPPPPDAVTAADVCGYCGKEFANEPQPDWDDRIAHLTNVHKFGECNQSKKFFRADHFRQHLKHSHAGTSGKWTNVLEGECMKDEPLPDVMPLPAPIQQAMQQPMQQPMHQMQAIQPGPGIGLGGAPIANMGILPGPVPGQPVNMLGSSDLRDETIDEMKHEM
ncbi:MAG: hypothetical protein Q9201_005063 [Fulgogasparrea decipioides]